MIRRFVVRAVETAVLLLAAYTFFFVQVGRRTPWDHLVAIFSTEPAHEAVEDFTHAGFQLRDKVVQGVHSAVTHDAGTAKGDAR